MKVKKLWITLALVFFGSFAILIYYGGEIFQKAPPIPEKVITLDGQVLYTKEDIQNGQNVWQRMGGQELGSIWGHGAYVAPDWTADWLHRELTWLLDHWAQSEYQSTYEGLSLEQQASLKARLKVEIRTNTYDPATGAITVSADRALSIQAMKEYYVKVFGDDPSMDEYRSQIAVPDNTIRSAEDHHSLSAFFFWATWSTSTNRPGMDITYTNNWPGEPLIDNVPTQSTVMWSIISVILLIAGVGALAWYFAVQRHREAPEQPAPKNDPLLNIKVTPSMRATLKYFWIVTALILVQVGLGAITAHYGVEGDGFYGIPLAEWFPYTVTRTWHQQLAIFWIATAWLATGLYMGPAISGYEPKYQRLGVNFLFGALLLIVVGSMVGQWMAIKGYITDLQSNFYFGHQGFEYVDLGRAWQILLSVGLFLWFFLMARAVWPAIRQKSEGRHMLILFLLASVAIPVFYTPSLMWGQHTHLSVSTYWRWWVVHLWVEGFFEVFAAVVISFLFSRMGLIRTATATSTVLFSTIIFLFGGIIGTFHHLYFAGTPTGVLAFGAVFSALEVVPLLLIGFEAYENLRHSRASAWVSRYRWPIYFFVAVSFWNLVGAGIFGFLINPPIALYYMQGLNTTALHAHTALFGVYGMLGIGLMLFCLRGLSGTRSWKTKLLRFSFWSLNIGLMVMGVTSLLPVGIIQALNSMKKGMWYARSVELLHSPVMQNLVWFRAVGDTIFALGIVGIVWFVVGLKTGKSLEQDTAVHSESKTYHV
ncbi:nitric oxide reductase subunit B [Paenibacillus phyllosphaerae]|uniref:Nitric oxide reductase subunit B n=1 Tax=Paenibacillus phyllosphaerae TaxID=274593 RepID=A0A7W5AYK9_9BACL|nr:nitric-oxide reductase large subunit [Paenibacillus phyllosphaerae]MBB3111155.1 nitric oxide reductase subunit B [Paenibacillus phyllosphaerae]